MEDAILKFAKGKFFLEDVGSSKLRLKLHGDTHWKNLGNDSYETTSLGSARTFRRYADEKVEKLFKKTFQEFYPDKGWQVPEILDPHQRQGITWILTRKRSYLAHAPGAGKTAQAIIAASLADSPALFIVPPSLVTNWKREIEKWYPWVPDDYRIVPDSLIARPGLVAVLSGFGFICVDEASRLKTPFAQRSLAFYGGRDDKGNSFQALFREARHVVFLDGSPMPNRPMELWAPTYALDPESIDCMAYDDFGYRYCGARPNDRGQWEYLFSSNEEELKRKLQKSFMHVVPESTLQHPERKRSILFLSHDVRSRDHREWEQRNLSQVSRLTENNSRGDLARFRRELGLRKVPLALQYLKEKLEKNEKILVFAWHQKVCEEIWKQLGEHGQRVITGKTPMVQREEAVRAYQEGTDCRVLIMNIAAAGRGLNLQATDRVIFVEFSWTDETNKQAEKRASRKGSTKSQVRCEYLVCPGSMDEVVLRSVFSKERRVERIIGK